MKGGGRAGEDITHGKAEYPFYAKPGHVRTFRWCSKPNVGGPKLKFVYNVVDEVVAPMESKENAERPLAYEMEAGILRKDRGSRNGTDHGAALCRGDPSHGLRAPGGGMYGSDDTTLPPLPLDERGDKGGRTSYTVAYGDDSAVVGEAYVVGNGDPAFKAVRKGKCLHTRAPPCKIVDKPTGVAARVAAYTN